MTLTWLSKSDSIETWGNRFVRTLEIDYQLSLSSVLGGSSKHFLCSPFFSEMTQFDDHIFQMSWFNHHLFVSFVVRSPLILTPASVFMQIFVW